MTNEEVKNLYTIKNIRGQLKLSNDPKTKTAAQVLSGTGGTLVTTVKSNYILHPKPETLTREERLKLSHHAEIHAITCHPVTAVGGEIYITGSPCFQCAKAIIVAGINSVMIDDEMDPFKDRMDDPAYDFREGLELLETFKVKVTRIKIALEPGDSSEHSVH